MRGCPEISSTKRALREHFSSRLNMLALPALVFGFGEGSKESKESKVCPRARARAIRAAGRLASPKEAKEAKNDNDFDNDNED
jgi:hypothetical protein